MSNKTACKDIDITSFEEKVYMISDELLCVLKELSREKQHQINSKLIADKMSKKESVKKALTGRSSASSNSAISSNNNDHIELEKIAGAVIEKLSEIVPPHMTGGQGPLKGLFDGKNSLNNSMDWLNSLIGVLKKYIASLSNRNKELEEFMKQTLEHLAGIESPLAGEISSQQQKFREDMEFEDNLRTYMNTMKDEYNASGDISALKTAFLSRIENINRSFEKKREKDISRLKETEKTLEEMRKRMDEVKHEADEIRKKSEKMKIESYQDALTGLHNRRAYDEKIIEILANVEKGAVTASLMICDIDFFKKINDNLGHKTGDLALKKLADLLKERLRGNDFIARYGGEEFAVILPHTDLTEALKAAEGLRSYIAQSVFSYKGNKIPLTVSAGVSSFRKGDSAGSVFERADRALYLAKNSGRNTVRTENDAAAA